MNFFSSFLFVFFAFICLFPFSCGNYYFFNSTVRLRIYYFIRLLNYSPDYALAPSPAYYYLIRNLASEKKELNPLLDNIEKSHFYQHRTICSPHSAIVAYSAPSYEMTIAEKYAQLSELVNVCYKHKNEFLVYKAHQEMFYSFKTAVDYAFSDHEKALIAYYDRVLSADSDKSNFYYNQVRTRNELFTRFASDLLHTDLKKETYWSFFSALMSLRMNNVKLDGFFRQMILWFHASKKDEENDDEHIKRMLLASTSVESCDCKNSQKMPFDEFLTYLSRGCAVRFKTDVVECNIYHIEAVSPSYSLSHSVHYSMILFLWGSLEFVPMRLRSLILHRMDMDLTSDAFKLAFYNGKPIYLEEKEEKEEQEEQEEQEEEEQEQEQEEVIQQALSDKSDSTNKMNNLDKKIKHNNNGNALHITSKLCDDVLHELNKIYSLPTVKIYEHCELLKYLLSHKHVYMQYFVNISYSKYVDSEKPINNSIKELFYLENNAILHNLKRKTKEQLLGKVVKGLMRTKLLFILQNFIIPNHKKKVEVLWNWSDVFSIECIKFLNDQEQRKEDRLSSFTVEVRSQIIDRCQNLFSTPYLHDWLFCAFENGLQKSDYINQKLMLAIQRKKTHFYNLGLHVLWSHFSSKKDVLIRLVLDDLNYIHSYMLENDFLLLYLLHSVPVRNSVFYRVVKYLNNSQSVEQKNISLYTVLFTYFREFNSLNKNNRVSESTRLLENYHVLQKRIQTQFQNPINNYDTFFYTFLPENVHAETAALYDLKFDISLFQFYENASEAELTDYLKFDVDLIKNYLFEYIHNYPVTKSNVNYLLSLIPTDSVWNFIVHDRVNLWSLQAQENPLERVYELLSNHYNLFPSSFSFFY